MRIDDLTTGIVKDDETRKNMLIDRPMKKYIDFFGRQSELNAISTAFVNHQMVVLSGMGGIGKTELATDFLCNHANNGCQKVVFGESEQIGIENLLTKLSYDSLVIDKYQTLAKTSIDMANHVLINAASQAPTDYILFIDNANNINTRCIKDILDNFGCKVLITTRKNPKLPEGAVNIDIGELEKSIARELFVSVYGKLDEEESRVFDQDVYDYFYGNTLAIVMTAKMLKIQGVKITAFKQKKEKLLKESKFDVNIHGEEKFDTVAANLSESFKITQITENNSGDFTDTILSIMMLVEQVGIKESAIVEHLNLDTSNEFLVLSDKGLINRIEDEGDYILTMHPIIVRALELYGIKPDKDAVEFVKSYYVAEFENFSVTKYDMNSLFRLINRIKSKIESAETEKVEPEKKEQISTLTAGSEKLDILDILLDESNTAPLILSDNNGRRICFEQVAVIPYNERIFCILRPLDKIAEVSDNEAVVFYVEEKEGEEPVLMACSDQETAENVFKHYYALLIEAI